MNRIIILLLCCIFLSAHFIASADNRAEEATGPVYIFSLDDEINGRAWRTTRRACDEAVARDARLVVVRMNTYGGALDAADSIRSALLALKIPTVAFIDHNAASAGALIALACDTVYMTPGSSMGAATVVNGSGEAMPDKYQSYMSSIMRTTAESHGKYTPEGDSVARWRRNPEIAARMVRGDSIVSFTSSEAVAAGYAEGIVSNLNEALRLLGHHESPAEEFEQTLSDEILGFLSDNAVRAILIMLILGGIYMEMHSPGLGFAAAVSVIAAILFFLPIFIVGQPSSWVLLLFITGIILVVLEIFVIPGFGVCGILGITAVIIAMAAAMMPSGGQWLDKTLMSQVIAPVLTVFTGLLMSIGLVAWLTSRHGPKFIRRHSELMKSLDNAEGYIGVDMSPATFVGNHATTVTDMRPAGKIKIGDKIYDAVSTGDFIEAGSRVKIVKYENAQLYIEKPEP